MRTTLNINDDLMIRVKEVATKTGKTITAIVEEALAREVAGDSRAEGSYRLDWNVVGGPPAQGVDVADRDALIEKMEHRY